MRGQPSADAKRTLNEQANIAGAPRASERSTERRRAMITAWVGGTVIALVAALLVLEGCGGGDAHSTRAANADVVMSAPAGTVVASNELPHTYGPATGEEAQRRLVASNGSPESVAPDAIVSVSDTLVSPGQPIVVTVEGTSDVTEMALSDGHGDPLPMVRDSTQGVWRVNYRVPLRPRQERLGLAVTAKNDAHRWRRVWLFLQVDSGKQQLENELDCRDGDEPR